MRRALRRRGIDADRGIGVRLLVECECGWTRVGDENAVVEAMQVHQRQIHGREMTRDEVRRKTRLA
jgi:hypothetical protein